MKPARAENSEGLTGSTLSMKKLWQLKRYPLIYSDPKWRGCEIDIQGIRNTTQEPSPVAQERLLAQGRRRQTHG